ncbi:delta 1-pyrroline-5-carboxylate reductase [Puccinia graminis f. sp. tritici]|uniref:Pyrroline-5-carboxylate reductase n=1 Tax=Puccinia graminis f. sp. tritici TaxID=56615 RepID=A0A5B0QGC1_PUCGR|nr:delta 1-pyrroline-5-carboxylate reductase [Puccinia graminis f. sp. tritici]KAA1112248.1 delta 1-pyrroline-5-carboxylate reductase [Puccinia graminis f. sp. tritici]KAA1123447.1 delta 1-pyrroline-5-carboxylate reductase [Puccinia graminis f. sp. tritici]
MPYSLCVLGCGTMGVAILSGVIESLKTSKDAQPSSSVPQTPTAESDPDVDAPTEDSIPNRFVTCVSRPESARKLKKRWLELGREDIEVRVSDNVRGVAECDVILLGCKPQMAKDVLGAPGMQEALSNKLLISILAGTTTSQLRSFVPSSTRVVRAMPNTPCQIREGMTILSALSPDCSFTTQTRAILLALFTPISRCRFLDEKHFDACTAVSASGPAFSLVILEAIADGGVMMGLPRAEALELAAQAMQGAARMSLQTGLHPAALKDSVTTPAGCTIAGLLAMEDGRIRSTIARAIQTATLHAAGLGGAPKPSLKD